MGTSAELQPDAPWFPIGRAPTAEQSKTEEESARGGAMLFWRAHLSESAIESFHFYRFVPWLALLVHLACQIEIASGVALDAIAFGIFGERTSDCWFN